MTRVVMAGCGRPVLFARAHPVVVSVAACVLIVLLVEAVGVAICSFLLPSTG